MTTLITVGNSSGTSGRCDAKCYDAKHEQCDCICGGRNHGRGLEKAIDNTREMMIGEEANRLLKNYAKEHGTDATNIVLDGALQGKLL